MIRKDLLLQFPLLLSSLWLHPDPTPNHRLDVLKGLIYKTAEKVDYTQVTHRLHTCPFPKNMDYTQVTHRLHTGYTPSPTLSNAPARAIP